MTTIGGLTWIQVVLTALATFRVSRLITTDAITDRPRSWMRAKLEGTFVEFWSCLWCVSMWVGAAATVLTIYQWTEWWGWATLALSTSAVAGYIAEKT